MFALNYRRLPQIKVIRPLNDIYMYEILLAGGVAMILKKFIKRSCSPSKGFSLIELLIVMALLAIAGAISIPGFQTYAKNARLRAAVSDVEAEIKKAHQTAIKKNENTATKNPYEYRLSFSTTDNSYSLTRMEKDKDDTSVTIATTTLWTKYADMSQNGNDKEVTMTNASFSGQPYIDFFNRGTTSAQNGDSIKLTNTSGRTAKITVNVTGRTYVQIPSPD
jgi:prepilin-type N-terminal cleavage/methylation domain-containing protein